MSVMGLGTLAALAQLAYAGLQPLAQYVAGQRFFFIRKGIVQMTLAAVERLRNALDGQLRVAQIARHVRAYAVFQRSALRH